MCASIVTLASFSATSTGSDGTIQSWVVPHTSLYEVTGAGAEGGYLEANGNPNGLGAQGRAALQLQEGDELLILVGQEGGTGTSSAGQAGGGGTFICRVVAEGEGYEIRGGEHAGKWVEPLLVLGGGAGSPDATPDWDSPHGRADTRGVDFKSRGNSNSSGAGGGGGFDLDGGGYSGNAGRAFLNGGQGGGSAAQGGFGGGGGKGGGYNDGAGGGGWDGGDHSYEDNAVGGGGGSYVIESAIDVEILAGENRGDGWAEFAAYDEEGSLLSARIPHLMGAPASRAMTNMAGGRANRRGKDGKIHEFIVGDTGIYRLRVAGAGLDKIADLPTQRGAILEGLVPLTAGDRLKLLIGQLPWAGRLIVREQNVFGEDEIGDVSAGCGGTFIAKVDPAGEMDSSGDPVVPLLIAGGAGGHIRGNARDEIGGQAGEDGGYGGDENGILSGTPGTDGGAGQSDYGNDHSASGFRGASTVEEGTSPQSFLSGGTGGSFEEQEGGFGCAAAGANISHSGVGAGGGYSGGAGGEHEGFSGGGGSFAANSVTVLERVGAAHVGPGELLIEYRPDLSPGDMRIKVGGVLKPPSSLVGGSAFERQRQQHVAAAERDLFRVLRSGVYQIEVAGARGGGLHGGRGAKVELSLYLAADTVLDCRTGAPGALSGSGASGGGYSAVAILDGELLAMAGGGGGVYFPGENSEADGRATEMGGAGFSSDYPYAAAPGRDGEGGRSVGSASAGAGYYTSGSSQAQSFSGGSNGCTDHSVHGGYGGGGSAYSGSSHRGYAGGGGGYSGGGGAGRANEAPACGGGGGSYIASRRRLSSAVIAGSNAGGGRVRVALLQERRTLVVSVPSPLAAPSMVVGPRLDGHVYTGFVAFVPLRKAGNYLISARGAQGGGEHGGLGAVVEAVFYLDRGYYVSVAGQGGDWQSECFGGGGATVVADADGTPLVIAAGGGGSNVRHPVAHGSVGTAQNGYGTAASYEAGSDGEGGHGQAQAAGGGGGLRSTGQGDTSASGGIIYPGPSISRDDADGGFGGGGAALSPQGAVSYYSAGGGGGYSGGGIGISHDTEDPLAGGGGSSYVAASATLIHRMEGGIQEGHGWARLIEVIEGGLRAVVPSLLAAPSSRSVSRIFCSAVLPSIVALPEIRFVAALEAHVRGALPSPLGGVAARTLVDWTAADDAGIQTYYAAYIGTGEERFEVPIVSWQATVQNSGQSFIQAVVRDDDTAALEGIRGEELTIYRGARIESGHEMEVELARGVLEQPQFNLGTTRQSATLRARQDADYPDQFDRRTLKGVRSITTGSGGTRVRADIDFFLRPGMVAVAESVEFRARYLNYYVTRQESYMDVGS